VTAVRVIAPEDWRTWREIRLRALLESPEAFGSTHAREVAMTEDDWRGRLGSHESVSVLAEDGGGRAVGMGGGFPDRPGLLHVVAMWVAPEARGRGVAHDVLRCIEAWAAERGLGLHLDVNTRNAVARRSYERYGFVATGSTRPLRAGSTDLVENLVLPIPR
jgi:GNAT superfamily N-acetyltransferase